MKNLIKIVCLSLFSVITLNAQQSKQNDVTVVISNLNSNNGRVFVALYNSESTFLGKGIKSDIRKIENNSCTIVFKDVPNGTYAVSMFHDENDNNKMDTNLFGIPKEDYGCSNNVKGFMGPPKWEDAKFQIQNESITQYIKI
ncbi:uncharacterized protein (DUF2141 family) [Mariniflexile fucanivorans]|uniref:Uncharacterized protein (DUF2141 family) n=1 Tax=Mariniflexile fucanivorans TaxID=264023 RepID=A0A4V2QE49_9FLAO|nr:DUF2141 domain-containing protein [Mariniflexile fucanivorans]TCL66747.1 uncharacterized protein (DUF2141 family) [Mariniflexile fucanivorans]